MQMRFNFSPIGRDVSNVARAVDYTSPWFRRTLLVVSALTAFVGCRVPDRLRSQVDSQVSVRAFPDDPNAGGMAILHHAAICSLDISDPTGAHYDIRSSFGNRHEEMTRATALSRTPSVEWSKRKAGNLYVTPIALPAGHYVLKGYRAGPVSYVKDSSPGALIGHSACIDEARLSAHSLDLAFDVLAGEVTLIGKLDCATDACNPSVDTSPGARGEISSVLHEDVALKTGGAAMVTLWESWTARVDRATQSITR